MKKLTFLLFVLCLTQAKAQFFNNVNSELCYQLYETSDHLSGYRVYMVVDEENFEDKDYKMLDQWKTLSQGQRSKITQRWAMEGKRIESERAPCITYPPVYPNHNYVVPEPFKSSKPLNTGPWEGGKKFWMYSDRPF